MKWVIKLLNEIEILISKFRVVPWRFISKIGHGVRFGKGVLLLSPAGVSIDNNSEINVYTRIDGKGGVTIGKNVMIGSYCEIISFNYSLSVEDRINKSKVLKPIVINDNVWIGTGVVILAGSIIGANSVIGANTVINGIVDDDTVVYGDRSLISNKIVKQKM